MARRALYKNVAKRIFDVESFEVRIRQGQHELKPNDTVPCMWPYENQAPNKWTVSTWQERKFAKHYPQHEVDILNGQGQAVRRNSVLWKVRDSYNPESE